MGIKHPSRHHSTPSESLSRHPSKRREPNDSVPRSTKSPSANHLKSKIRDLTRALEHSDRLPPGVRIEKERALAGYKQDVEKIQNDKRKNELIKKYHMVRFFERQKATRTLKKLQRLLDASSSSSSSTAPETAEHNELTRQLRDAEIDLYYTTYYPLTEKYQSLFPRRQADAAGAEGSSAARKLVAEKPAMWKVIERCAADGTLEALRDGTLRATSTSTSTSAVERKSAQKEEKEKSQKKTGPEPDGRSGGARSSSSKGAVPPQEQQGEESDGGFFEE